MFLKDVQSFKETCILEGTCLVNKGVKGHKAEGKKATSGFSFSEFF